MKSILPILGWAAAGLALLASFAIDLAHNRHDGAVDFRNRITGARLLEHGLDPYRYIWHPGDPAEYCDTRNNPKLPVSKTTVTPALLLLHAPLAALPYRQAQFLWLFAQWLMLLGAGWLWWRAAPTPLARGLVVATLVAFSYSTAWRWEAERGQTYMLLIFLFSLWLTMSLDPKRLGPFAPGFVAGFLVALRPPFALLLPFLVLHRRGQWPGAALGLLLGLALPLLLNPAGWTDYLSAMQANSDLYRHNLHPVRDPQAFPSVIEGTPTSTLAGMINFPYGDITVYALLRRVGIAPISAAPPLLALGALYAAWLWFSRALPTPRLLPGLAAWLFLVDLVLPTTRYGYYDMMALNVVLCALVAAGRGPTVIQGERKSDLNNPAPVAQTEPQRQPIPIPWTLWPCLVALPASAALCAFPHPPAWLFSVPASAFTLTALLSLFPLSRAEPASPVAAVYDRRG
jgi:hypothetical protein